MSSIGYPGYQLYALPEGLFVIGGETAELLNKKSKHDLESIITAYLKEAGEEDIFIDYKINRGMLGDN